METSHTHLCSGDRQLRLTARESHLSHTVPKSYVLTAQTGFPGKGGVRTNTPPGWVAISEWQVGTWGWERCLWGMKCQDWEVRQKQFQGFQIRYNQAPYKKRDTIQTYYTKGNSVLLLIQIRGQIEQQTDVPQDLMVKRSLKRSNDERRRHKG